jgi:hypothetical protein
MRVDRRNWHTLRKPSSAPFCPQQMHYLNRDRIHSAAMVSQPLTAWAMARQEWWVVLMKTGSRTFLICDTVSPKIICNLCLLILWTVGVSTKRIGKYVAVVIRFLNTKHRWVLKQTCPYIGKWKLLTLENQTVATIKQQTFSMDAIDYISGSSDKNACSIPCGGGAEYLHRALRSVGGDKKESLESESHWTRTREW